jgi:hypothetical protein
MFVFREKRAFDWPVAVVYPVDGGKTEEQRFVARFEISGNDLTDAGRIGRLEGEEAARDFLERTLVGWSDIRTETGEELPFSPENRDALLADPFVLGGIAQAIAECLSGARAKNSGRPRPIGLVS